MSVNCGPRWRVRTILAVAVVMAVASMCDLFVVPQRRFMGSADGLERKQAELRLDWALLDREVEIRGDFRRLAPSMKDVNGSFGDASSLLKRVESTARRSGVKVKDLRPQSPVGGNDRLPAVSLSAETSWASLIRFLDELRRSPQGWLVDKVSIESINDEAAALKVNMGIVSAAGLAAPDSPKEDSF